MIAVQSDPLCSIYSTHSVEIANAQRTVVRDSPHSFIILHRQTHTTEFRGHSAKTNNVMSTQTIIVA